MDEIKVTSLSNDYNAIKPLNNCFYRNCFYNCILAILNSYGKNTLELILNDRNFYKLREENGYYYLGIEYYSYMPLKQFLFKMGINTSNYYIIGDNLKKELLAHIQSRRLIILWVDNFYLTYKDNYYQKKHHLENLLVYASNDIYSEFYVIDTRDSNSIIYNSYIVSDTTLAEAYNGALKFNKYNLFTPFSTFYNEEPWRYTTNINWKMWYLLKINSKEISDKNNYKIIYKFADIIVNCIKNKNLDYLSLIIIGLNEIVLAKETDLKTVCFLFPEDKLKIMYYREILKLWKKIRGLCVKLHYLDDWNINYCDKVSSYLNEVINLEINFSKERK